MKKGYYLPLAVSLAVPQLAGAVGALFTMSAIPGWYATLARPELAPPNWVFGPVWTALFVLMGVAAFIVWRRGKGRVLREAMLAYYLQLALNVLWSVLFFGLQSPYLALWGIAALWLGIALTLYLFLKVSRTAALLMVPYLAWVSFASYLNFMILLLN
jgi:tryptophan-rich sensory protein